MSRPMCLPWGARCLKTLQFVWDRKSIHPGKINMEHNEIHWFTLFFSKMSSKVTPWKIDMEHNNEGLVQMFLSLHWVKISRSKSRSFSWGVGLKLPKQKSWWQKYHEFYWCGLTWRPETCPLKMDGLDFVVAYFRRRGLLVSGKGPGIN